MTRYETHDIERRQHARYSGNNIRGNILNSNDLEVLNISMNGAAIETAKRVELNREYTIRIHFHESSFHMRGLIVWAMLISKEKNDKTIVPLYRAGVKFMHVSNEKANLIRNCIAGMQTKTQESSSSRITYCF
jgi:PilZ domain